MEPELWGERTSQEGPTWTAGPALFQGRPLRSQQGLSPPVGPWPPVTPRRGPTTVVPEAFIFIAALGAFFRLSLELHLPDATIHYTVSPPGASGQDECQQQVRGEVSRQG